ncbi:MAG TPA: tetratricopeptide repeat protein [Candidatus Limnocylindrales bacterium]|nr:tetratricopeptide repeat protein [Candidatus Limnocylindrales bacterium]
MIELMLEAERAMGIGLLDNAERLYAQVVAIDPKNSIAVTGLARVALERGDQRGAYTFARRALALDPDNPMASHLSLRMAEQMRNRGEPLPDDPSSATEPVSPAPTSDGAPAAAASSKPAARSGIVGRFLRRRR